ncbi:thymic stromal lymphopoietin [Macrotis lagotis]|uniref:thymic stromal lymphopoietin n=1 Tax=Macrotis lagotis TaxID=92651 RepID=UPI003D6894E8
MVAHGRPGTSRFLLQLLTASVLDSTSRTSFLDFDINVQYLISLRSFGNHVSALSLSVKASLRKAVLFLEKLTGPFPLASFTGFKYASSNQCCCDLQPGYLLHLICTIRLPPSHPKNKKLITLLQLTGMVLSYNFRRCNHYEMASDYENTIYNTKLESLYDSESSSSENSNLFCKTKSGCLTIVEKLARNWSNNCSIEMGETFEDFVNRTRIALKNYCPAFQENQANNTKAPEKNMEERIKKMTCSEIARNLLEIWREYWKKTENSTSRRKRREDKV